MPAAPDLEQPAPGAEPAAAVSHEWRCRGDPAALWRAWFCDSSHAAAGLAAGE